MGTRSNIRVRGGQLDFMLYRHWDGYPAETGAHLLETLKASGLTGDLSNRHPDDCAAQFVNRLLRTFTARDDGPAFSYEVTTGLHGDIEHLYEVRFTNGGWVEILHGPIDRESEDDAATFAALVPYMVPEFAAMVNKERASCTARLKAVGRPEVMEPVSI